MRCQRTFVPGRRTLLLLRVLGRSAVVKSSIWRCLSPYAVLPLTSIPCSISSRFKALRVSKRKLGLKDAENDDAIWKDDRLGYKDIGLSFTNLIQSIEDQKVISIEAGFGRGKTFFRKAWAKQLRGAGEVVVEVDVQQSDHSGDPIITLLGALVEALPQVEKGKGEKALESAKKVGAIGTRALTRAILKSGADEVFEAITASAIDQLEDFDALDGVIKDVGNEMSKVASQIIASQMAAEKVRKVELPEQLNALRSALVEGAAFERVVVVIDELDRCHPEYAISFLEATKLVFSHSGFVFCLMVNANYLENLARHRFGVAQEDERYLDKFVDIRLKLEPTPANFATAVYDLACKLPLRIPYGEGDEFSVENAAGLASRLASECAFSMRKTKRILLKVEMALRCYAKQPLDATLLVFLAFQDEAPGIVSEDHLPRSFLTPEEGAKIMERGKFNDPFAPRDERQWQADMNKAIKEKAPELLTLPDDRYDGATANAVQPWALAFGALAPHYIPSHRDVLDNIALVMISEDQTSA